MMLKIFNLSLALSLSLISFSSLSFAMQAPLEGEQVTQIVRKVIKKGTHNTDTHNYKLIWKTYPHTEMRAQKQRCEEVASNQRLSRFNAVYQPIIHVESEIDTRVLGGLKSGELILKSQSSSSSRAMPQDKEYKFEIFKVEDNVADSLMRITIQESPLQ